MTIKIELKRVSHSKSLSEETPAYTAQIWIDGAYLCDVSNHGQGGSDSYHPARAADVKGFNNFYDHLKAVEARVAAELPPVSVNDVYNDGEEHEPMKQSLELFCHMMLDEMAVAADLRRLLKRTIAFHDGKAIRSYTGKHEGVERAHLVTATIRKYPTATILNNLPFDEALKLFRGASV